MYVAYKLDTIYGSIKSRPTILRFKALELLEHVQGRKEE